MLPVATADARRTKAAPIEVELLSTSVPCVNWYCDYPGTPYLLDGSSKAGQTNGNLMNTTVDESDVILTWFAPKGMYSATIIDTELRVITSSSSSRI